MTDGGHKLSQKTRDERWAWWFSSFALGPDTANVRSRYSFASISLKRSPRPNPYFRNTRNCRPVALEAGTRRGSKYGTCTRGSGTSRRPSTRNFAQDTPALCLCLAAASIKCVCSTHESAHSLLHAPSPYSPPQASFWSVAIFVLAAGDALCGVNPADGLKSGADGLACTTDALWNETVFVGLNGAACAKNNTFGKESYHNIASAGCQDAMTAYRNYTQYEQGIVVDKDGVSYNGGGTLNCGTT